MTMTPDGSKIIQIIPATGVRVHYEEPDGSQSSVPLLLWGLTDRGDVAALDVTPTGVEIVTTASNFSRLQNIEEGA